MGHGGFRPGGGRPPGSKNKAKIAEEAAALAVRDQLRKQVEAARSAGQEPVDYLLEVMRNPNEDKYMRLAAAKAAAPYRHPQLAAVQVQHLGADGQPVGPKLVHVERVIEAVPERDTKLLELPAASEGRH